MLPTNDEILKSLVSRVMTIDDITVTNDEASPQIRYRGQLKLDSGQAYDQLAASVQPYERTPLFRKEEDQHVILLIPAIIRVRPSNPTVNLVLFLLTLVTVIITGAFFYPVELAVSPTNELGVLLKNIASGIPFAVSLLSILLAHEFGHYLAGRYHKTHVTLPYFIPFPTLLGTLGAFIQLKEPPKNKRILLDIGIAGPIAGLAVALPVLFLGLSLSKIEPIVAPAGLEGNSLIYLLAKYIVFGQWLPQPSSYGNLSPLLYWIRYFFTSQPLPVGGQDVFVHPIAWAGWAGLLVTALNLIPAGQLDGGHVISTLIGKQARKLLPFILIVLVVLGFFSQVWWLWAVLLLFLGRWYAEPLDQITPLNPARKALAIFGLVLFLLVFTPVPLVKISMGR